MEIILREDVQHLGRAGDVVKVKDGYARNYLLPKGLAYAATEANKKRITYEAQRLAKQRVAEKEAAVSEAQRLAGVELTFPVKVGAAVARGQATDRSAGADPRAGRLPGRHQDPPGRPTRDRGARGKGMTSGVGVGTNGCPPRYD